MAAPLVGQRVIVDGLSSKPELNGTKGTAVSFDDAKGRYYVRLDSGGEPIALKPNNVLADRQAGGMPGMGGGMPGGMGGMPGFGGMPGMGGMGRGGLAALLAQLMQQYGGGGGQLPFGLTPQQLGMGAMALLMALRLTGLGLMQGVMLGGVGLVAAKAASGPQGTVILGRVGDALGRITGRPVSNLQAGVVLAAVVFFCGRYMLGSGGAGAAGAAASSSYAAYTKGYQDAQADRPFDPISDAPAAVEQAGSKWGLGTLINLLMAGGMLYQLGGGGTGQPWSPQAFAANLKRQNPINLLIMFNLLSSIFF